MEKKFLGNSDLNITRTGFGAWAIGGSGWIFGWGHQDDKDSVRAILTALEMGVNWIDTAAVYGCGHSEEIVAIALKEWTGQKPYVFTKCSLVWDKDHNITSNHTPASIRKECESSLRRLKTDTIDLYQIHWPPANGNSEIESAWEEMCKLQKEGKTRWIGVSNFNKEQIQIAENISPVTSLQPPYNLIDRKYEKVVLPYCAEVNIGVIVYSPMVCGLLSGTFTKERAENLPEDDWRHKSSNFIEPKLSKNLVLADKCIEIGKRYDRSAGEIAIAWTLLNPSVTGAIVGARNASQAKGVMNASNILLSNEEKSELESILS